MKREQQKWYRSKQIFLFIKICLMAENKNCSSGVYNVCKYNIWDNTLHRAEKRTDSISQIFFKCLHPLGSSCHNPSSGFHQLSLQQLPNLVPTLALNFNPFSKLKTKGNSCHLFLTFIPHNQAYKSLPHLAPSTSLASIFCQWPSPHSSLPRVTLNFVQFLAYARSLTYCLAHGRTSLKTLTKWKNKFLEDSYSLGGGEKAWRKRNKIKSKYPHFDVKRPHPSLRSHPVAYGCVKGNLFSRVTEHRRVKPSVVAGKSVRQG